MASFASKFGSSVKGSKRMLIVIGGALVVVVVALWLNSGGREVPTSQVRGPLQRQATVQGQKPVSQTYEAQLVKDDGNRVTEAKKTGTVSALPTVRVVDGTATGMPNENRNKDDDKSRLQRPRPPQIAMPPVGLPPLPAAPVTVRVADNVPDLTPNLMRAAMADLGRVAYPAADVKYYYKHQASAAAAQGGDAKALQAQTATGYGGGTGTLGGIPLPLPGTIVYAELVGEANSDAQGPVLARILQGELAGATVIGTFQTQRDSLQLRFSTISLGTSVSGEEINKATQISAVGVDSRTVGTAIATDVDHHFIVNVGSQAAASFAQGFGSAIAQSGQMLTATSGVGYQVTNPTRTLSQQLQIAGAAAGAGAGQAIVQTYGNRPTTITIAAGTPIGILFMPDGNY